MRSADRRSRAMTSHHQCSRSEGWLDRSSGHRGAGDLVGDRDVEGRVPKPSSPPSSVRIARAAICSPSIMRDRPVRIACEPTHLDSDLGLIPHGDRQRDGFGDDQQWGVVGVGHRLGHPPSCNAYGPCADRPSGRLDTTYHLGPDRAMIGRELLPQRLVCRPSRHRIRQPGIQVRYRESVGGVGSDPRSGGANKSKGKAPCRDSGATVRLPVDPHAFAPDVGKHRQRSAPPSGIRDQTRACPQR